MMGNCIGHYSLFDMLDFNSDVFFKWKRKLLTSYQMWFTDILINILTFWDVIYNRNDYISTSQPFD